MSLIDLENTNEYPELSAKVREIEKESTGEISLMVKNLQTQESFVYHADRPCKTASVIKFSMLVHVAMAIYEGTLSWNEPLKLTEEEKVAGSGVLTHLNAGTTFSLRDICLLMMIVSDNTATNMVIEHLGTAPINQRMRQLDLPITTVNRKAYSPDTPESLTYGLGVTTPREMIQLLSLIHTNSLGNEALCQDLMSILAKQQYRDGIPRLLPADWQYAGKTGAVDAVRNDVGFVTLPNGDRYALALFCQNIPTVQWTSDNPGLLAIAKLSRLLMSSEW